MLKVVSNTTPLISLLKLNRLEILKTLYNEIIIPTAVFQEIENGKNITKIKPLLIELTEKDVWLGNRLIKEICKLSNE
jgi:predicted nucleic acid-binding protein